jgi:hypothetical protein
MLQAANAPRSAIVFQYCRWDLDNKSSRTVAVGIVSAQGPAWANLGIIADM